MKVLQEWKDPLKSFFGKNTKGKEVLVETEYRLSAFILSREVEQKRLIFNTLTLDLVLLEENENQAYQDAVDLQTKKIINKDFLKSEPGQFLFKHFFILNEDDREMNIADEVLALNQLLYQKKHKKIKSFTILPTTECNARCFYCYEMGCEKITMNASTLDETITFILEKGDEEQIKISWFGGEPLLGEKVIDEISREIKKAGRKLRASMITNGYAFTPEMIKKAKEEWDLKKVQITLDGPEEEYNRIKAYVEPDENPFKRVMNNIKGLIEAGIRVSIRINHGHGQLESTLQLVEVLAKELGSMKKIILYCHEIFQDSDEGQDIKGRRQILEEKRRVNQKITNYGLKRTKPLPSKYRMNRCMADNDATVVILPDGKLTSCEHFNEGPLPWGDIETGVCNYKIKESWKETLPPIKECETCFYYPLCIKLKNCPNIRLDCLPEEREQHLDDLLEGMKRAYEEYLEKERSEASQEQL